jgi:hypothetical protein
LYSFCMFIVWIILKIFPRNKEKKMIFLTIEYQNNQKAEKYFF